MSAVPAAAAAFLAGYLPGSVPFGLLLFRLFRGDDLRRHGSGNIGATNALRAAGKRLGIATLVLDALKGAGGCLLAWRVGVELGAPWPAFWAVVAPVAGHCFPVWLRFAGGKGVATALGALAVASPVVLAIAGAIFLLLTTLSRRVSLGSIGAALAASLAALLLPGAANASGEMPGLGGGIVAASAIIVLRHRSNIARLLRGTEPPLGRRAVGLDGEER